MRVGTFYAIYGAPSRGRLPVLIMFCVHPSATSSNYLAHFIMAAALALYDIFFGQQHVAFAALPLQG